MYKKKKGFQLEVAHHSFPEKASGERQRQGKSETISVCLLADMCGSKIYTCHVRRVFLVQVSLWVASFRVLFCAFFVLMFTLIHGVFRSVICHVSVFVFVCPWCVYDSFGRQSETGNY